MPAKSSLSRSLFYLGLPLDAPSCRFCHRDSGVSIVQASTDIFWSCGSDIVKIWDSPDSGTAGRLSDQTILVWVELVDFILAPESQSGFWFGRAGLLVFRRVCETTCHCSWGQDRHWRFIWQWELWGSSHWSVDQVANWSSGETDCIGEDEAYSAFWPQVMDDLSLDVPEVQIVVHYPGDPGGFHWHHRVLLHRIDGGVWLTLTTRYNATISTLSGTGLWKGHHHSLVTLLGRSTPMTWSVELPWRTISGRHLFKLRSLVRAPLGKAKHSSGWFQSLHTLTSGRRWIQLCWGTEQLASPSQQREWWSLRVKSCLLRRSAKQTQNPGGSNVA